MSNQSSQLAYLVRLSAHLAPRRSRSPFLAGRFLQGHSVGWSCWRVQDGLEPRALHDHVGCRLGTLRRWRRFRRSSDSVAHHEP